MTYDDYIIKQAGITGMLQAYSRAAAQCIEQHDTTGSYAEEIAAGIRSTIAKYDALSAEFDAQRRGDA